MENKYKVISITDVIRKEGFDMDRYGLLVEDEDGNKIGGSLYTKSAISITPPDTITIEEVKKNKDGSHTFRGVKKVQSKKDIDIEIQPPF
jgi:hypothetical protein